MSKILSAERHDEVMEKLDTLSCQLHSISNAVRKLQAAQSQVAQPAKPASWWEQQCREKDATLTEALRKLAALEASL